MKTNRHLLSTFALVATIGMVGCGGAGDGDGTVAAAPAPPVGGTPPPAPPPPAPPPPAPPPAPAAAPSVPDSAGISVAAFFSFLRGLSGTDETSEPLVIRDNFAVPADESSEPTPLT